MANQELIDFIQSQLDQGIDLEIIKKNVIQKGFNKEDFNGALMDIIRKRAEQFDPMLDDSDRD